MKVDAWNYTEIPWGGRSVPRRCATNCLVSAHLIECRAGCRE